MSGPAKHEYTVEIEMEAAQDHPDLYLEGLEKGFTIARERIGTLGRKRTEDPEGFVKFLGVARYMYTSPSTTSETRSQILGTLTGLETFREDIVQPEPDQAPNVTNLDDYRNNQIGEAA